jgi:type VI secretion system protein ImpB
MCNLNGHDTPLAVRLRGLAAAIRPDKEASASMSGNIQNKLRQIRKPRVHISLDIETEGQVKKELPFVLGVMGDFSGLQGELRNDKGEVTRKLPSLTERGFVTIDRDNFDKVMAGMMPALSFHVDDKLTDSGKAVPVNLRFNSLDDFDPVNVAKQVPQLRKLMETRAKLRDLLAKADRSENLEKLLEELLRNSDNMKTVSRDLGPAQDKE